MTGSRKRPRTTGSLPALASLVRSAGAFIVGSVCEVTRRSRYFMMSSTSRGPSYSLLSLPWKIFSVGYP